MSTGNRVLGLGQILGLLLHLVLWLEGLLLASVHTQLACILALLLRYALQILSLCGLRVCCEPHSTHKRYCRAAAEQ